MIRLAANYLNRLPRHPFKLARALVCEPLDPSARHAVGYPSRRVGTAPRTADDLPVWLAHHPILYLDDNTDLVKLVSIMLERMSFTVIGATSAMDALEICQHVPLSLMMMNIIMPWISGIDLCRQLKADPILHCLPVIFYTACCTHNYVRDGLEAGAVAYMIKPASPQGLGRMVCEVLLAHGNWQVGPPQPDPALIARLVRPPRPVSDSVMAYLSDSTRSERYYTPNDIEWPHAASGY